MFPVPAFLIAVNGGKAPFRWGASYIRKLGTILPNDCDEAAGGGVTNPVGVEQKCAGSASQRAVRCDRV